MKILFTGAGSGGHFYPIIAIAEGIHDLVKEKKLIEPKLYYAAPTPYDRELLFANSITFIAVPAGKLYGYNIVRSAFGAAAIITGICTALWKLFFLYPDVVLGTGGYASFPTLVAARILGIPVIIYATDAEPSRVNRWAGKFAQKVAISFPQAASFFPADRVAFTGNPVRKSLMLPAREGAYEFLKLDPSVPIICVIGGSQGAMALNDVVLAALPQLVEKYQIVHQTGDANFTEVSGRAKIALGTSLYANRYAVFPYLNELALRMTAGVAKLIITRAGAGSIFEIATWGIPSIVIPIPETISHDQTKNAFAYAKTGAAVVIEQNNLTPGLLISEIDRIIEHPDIMRSMSEAARSFSRVDAARTIAEALLVIALSHESE